LAVVVVIHMLIHSQVRKKIGLLSGLNVARLGGSRYRPSGSSVPTAGPAGDPFTGASRYQPSYSAPAQDGSNSFVDPFTGANRYQPGNSVSPPVPSGSVATPALRALPHVWFYIAYDLTYSKLIINSANPDYLQAMQYSRHAKQTD
jgi:hypothetical protein